MRPLNINIFFIIILLVIAGCACDKGGDDDDSGDKSECIICSTTSECTDALGSGWVCVGDCCEDHGATGDDSLDGDDSGDDDGDEYGLNWIVIDGGFFGMGCSTGDDECLACEDPNHTVSVTGFKMTATEITQSQYLNIMAANPSAHTACLSCPVENVDWNMASQFCATAGGRLPTEAEWEYAARAGTTTKYYCGDEPSCLEDAAWFADNSSGQTQEVGLKEPNEFGLYDMLGNVLEWTNDWYADNYYESSPLSDPQGPNFGNGRSIRGGGIGADAWGVRISYRTSAAPDYAYNVYGFRCVKDGYTAE
jgi:formylglycine-generating enzyme required for sulfatase activity